MVFSKSMLDFKNSCFDEVSLNIHCLDEGIRPLPNIHALVQIVPLVP